MNVTGIIRPLMQRINSELPEVLRHRLLVRRRTSYYEDAGVVFIHIPKAAGSSINEALYGRFMGHYTAQMFLQAAPEIVKPLPRFAVTRNPWSRALSAYHFARRGRGAGEGVTAGMRNPGQYDIPAFDSFERFLIEWLDGKDVDRLDGVFRRQINYVADPDGKILVDHLGKVENLQATTDWLLATIQKQVEFPQGNKSGAPVDFRTSYTQETAEIVANIYRNDIAEFGYDF